MSDLDHTEKLIITLGQRISEQNEILRMITTSHEGIESHLRQIAFHQTSLRQETSMDLSDLTFI